MKKEDLFSSIGNIDDELLLRSEEPYRKNRSIWALYASCFILFLGVGIFMKTRLTEPVPYNPISKESEETSESLNTETTPPIVVEEQYVEIDSLLASNDIMAENVLKLFKVPIGTYQAFYEGILSVSSEQLSKSIGNQIENTVDAYNVLGHEDLQYIIRKEESGIYSLWKFQCFESSEYPYSDVLVMIYNIESAGDLESIISEPANMDNTDEGIKIQKKIGTFTISDEDQMNTLYQILLSLTCYGSDNWDLIDYGASDSGMQKSVQMGRYLTINAGNGCKIDGLKYTGVSGMFYEYSGIAYEKLSIEDKEAVENILNIEE
mgnify:CR=1 FL=1